VEDNGGVTDLLRRIRTEIDERLAASRAAAEEMERLEAALRALEGVGAPASPQVGATSARRARTSSGGARRRAPRAADGDAVPGASPEAETPPVPPRDAASPAPVPQEAAEQAGAGDDAGLGSDARPPGTYTGEY
jgi:hypothetical protein